MIHISVCVSKSAQNTYYDNFVKNNPFGFFFENSYKKKLKNTNPGL